MFSLPQGLCGRRFLVKRAEKKKRNQSRSGCPPRPTYQQRGITSFSFCLSSREGYVEMVNGPSSHRLHRGPLSFFLSSCWLAIHDWHVNHGKKKSAANKFQCSTNLLYYWVFCFFLLVGCQLIWLTCGSREENTTCEWIWTDDQSHVVDTVVP